MINAYDEHLVPIAQRALGSLMEYAVVDMHYNINTFWSDFLSSEVAKKFMSGDYQTIVGKSGIELFYEIYDTDEGALSDSFNAHKSPEYWLGFYLTYFHWQTSLDLNLLNKYVPIEEMLNMYFPYHEMSYSHFVDDVLEKYNKRKKYTNLQIYRKTFKMSRKDLSDQSGVSVRMIEKYEQRLKHINKASFDTVVSLAKALHVKPELLLEVYPDTSWRDSVKEVIGTSTEQFSPNAHWNNEKTRKKEKKP